MLQPETYEAQRRLADYCRTGKLDAIPGIDRNHIRHYRRLVFNVIKDTLEKAFPLTVSFLPTGEWDDLVDAFFSRHSCHSPQVFRLPGEFCCYVREHEEKLIKRYPFLNDLLFFEWIEIDLHLMPDLAFPDYTEKGDWFSDIIVLNPEHRLIAFQYPVHIHPPEQAKNMPGNYFLLLFREPVSGDIRFMNLSILFAYILEQINRRPSALGQILDDAARLFKIAGRNQLMKNTVSFLEELKREQFVLGFTL